MTITYETGDNLAVWPVSVDVEVNGFLGVFGLCAERIMTIETKSIDLSLKIPVRALTTYESAARYYLDIRAPISRQLLANFARVITDKSARAALVRINTDAAACKLEITSPRLSLAQALSTIAPGGVFQAISFSFLLENVAKL